MILPVFMTPCPCCLPTLTDSSCAIPYNAKVQSCILNGTVTGPGFSVWYKEHEEIARKRNASSNFFFLYPSHEVASQNMRHKQGLFQSLRQYIAAGFDPTSTDASNLDKVHDNGGILMLSNDCINHIQCLK